VLCPAVERRASVAAESDSPEAAMSGLYLDWGVLHISVTNLSVILAMIVVFALAILLPFPGHRHDDGAS
jgi:hypothetical protein